jgi:hypothetical protein
MNKLKYLGLLILLVLGTFAVSAQTEEPTEEPATEATGEATTEATSAAVAITLERTACFGSCPMYTVTIYEDGTIVYNGIRFVDVEGEQTSEIPAETVAAMVEALANAGYFEWEASYDNPSVSDLPSVITSVTRDGETHTINRYTAATEVPVALPFLEQWIDLMANTAMWTGVQTDLSANLNNGESPIATLERTACFGFCPVYNVALYADGTIVYTGIANVDNLGVSVLQTDPSAVESLALRAEGSGYFDMPDAYDTMTITDQSTVISSIRTEDNYKRITRYEGDASAPVGLTWIENAIDETVNFAMNPQ